MKIWEGKSERGGVVEVRLGWIAGEKFPFFWRNRMYYLLGLSKELRTSSPSCSAMTRVYKDASAKAAERWQCVEQQRVIKNCQTKYKVLFNSTVEGNRKF